MAKYEYWITEEGLLQIEGWARDGLIDEQIAHNIGIHRDTLYDWKKKHPDISDALKNGKEVVDRRVENALLKKALGFSYEEETFEMIDDLISGKQKLVLTKKVKKQVAPDATAQIYWLKNRKPKEWRDKQQVDIAVSTEDKVDELFNKLEGEIDGSS